MVVNPAYRTLDGQARKRIGVLNRKIAEFGAVNLEGEIEPCGVEAFTQRKSDLQDSIASLQKEIDELKVCEKPPNDIFRIKSCHRRHSSIA